MTSSFNEAHDLALVPQTPETAHNSMQVTLATKTLETQKQVQTVVSEEKYIGTLEKTSECDYTPELKKSRFRSPMPIESSEDDSAAVHIVNLKSMEGDVFPIEKHIIERQSITLKNLFECGIKHSETVPLDKCTSDALRVVVEWCRKHAELTVSSTAEDINHAKYLRQLTDEESEILQMDSEKLAELLKTAHFLEIPTLLDAGCMMAAKQIQAIDSAEGIQKYLNIQ
ncbi:hypothetical protein QR680_002463 [Steinernema hermaphroditum]|uniref:SKP1 component POZ domain-containing protein n=1 Tax=Steinernema hermaphroditum TaxID=289476 RepID=A0AA39H5I8_9BILA|nr:hypothetical protein QR680_002463 [Steinernema hermaphroditum]